MIGRIYWRLVSRLTFNKNPLDYISVTDFYKVYAYACLYSSLEKIPITSLTISFVESRYPRELLDHFRKVRGYTVEKNSPGIYYVKGDILPIQIINSRQLSADENLWLKGLSNKLDTLSVIQISDKVARRKKNIKVKAYMDVLTRANFHAIEEVMNMSSPAKSLEEVLERTGFTARVEERNTLAIAQNMINLGYPVEAIASATKLDITRVKELHKEDSGQ